MLYFSHGHQEVTQKMKWQTPVSVQLVSFGNTGFVNSGSAAMRGMIMQSSEAENCVVTSAAVQRQSAATQPPSQGLPHLNCRGIIAHLCCLEGTFGQREIDKHASLRQEMCPTNRGKSKKKLMCHMPLTSLRSPRAQNSLAEYFG